MPGIPSRRARISASSAAQSIVEIRKLRSRDRMVCGLAASGTGAQPSSARRRRRPPRRPPAGHGHARHRGGFVTIRRAHGGAGEWCRPRHGDVSSQESSLTLSPLRTLSRCQAPSPIRGSRRTCNHEDRKRWPRPPEHLSRRSALRARGTAAAAGNADNNYRVYCRRTSSGWPSSGSAATWTWRSTRSGPSSHCGSRPRRTGEVNALLDEHIGHVAHVPRTASVEKDLKSLRAQVRAASAGRMRHPQRPGPRCRRATPPRRRHVHGAH